MLPVLAISAVVICAILGVLYVLAWAFPKEPDASWDPWDS